MTLKKFQSCLQKKIKSNFEKTQIYLDREEKISMKGKQTFKWDLDFISKIKFNQKNKNKGKILTYTSVLLPHKEKKKR